MSKPSTIAPPLSLPFILGLLCAKWCVNHTKKRIRIYFPESKRYAVQLLKQQFGGTVTTLVRSNSRCVVWEASNNRSLKQIKEVANQFSDWLPREFYKQLAHFMRVHDV
jgi:hypothetical protein